MSELPYWANDARVAAAVLLVEQNAGLALKVTERGYLLQNGARLTSGPIECCVTIG